VVAQERLPDRRASGATTRGWNRRAGSRRDPSQAQDDGKWLRMVGVLKETGALGRSGILRMTEGLPQDDRGVLKETGGFGKIGDAQE
jgi:hypothetical protein